MYPKHIRSLNSIRKVLNESKALQKIVRRIQFQLTRLTCTDNVLQIFSEDSKMPNLYNALIGFECVRDNYSDIYRYQHVRARKDMNTSATTPVENVWTPIHTHKLRTVRMPGMKNTANKDFALVHIRGEIYFWIFPVQLFWFTLNSKFFCLNGVTCNEFT